MAISRVGGAVASAASVTTPAVQVGDIVVLWAFRDASATAPSAPTATGLTFVDRGSGGANTCSARLSTAKVATAGTYTITAANATRLIVEVYRGTGLAVGAVATATGGTGTVITYPGLTLLGKNSTSWALSFGAHRTATNLGAVPPSGMTNRQVAGTGPMAASFDTNAVVPSRGSATATVNASSGWRATSIELLEPSPVVGSGAATVSGPSLAGSGARTAPSAGGGGIPAPLGVASDFLPPFGLRSTSPSYTGAAGLWQRSSDGGQRTVLVNSTGVADPADKAWAQAEGGVARWLEVNLHDGSGNKFITDGIGAAPLVTFDTLNGVADVVGIQNDGARYLYTAAAIIPIYSAPTPQSSRWRMLYTLAVRHDAWIGNGRVISFAGEFAELDWNNTGSIALWAAQGNLSPNLYTFSDNGFRYDFGTAMPGFGIASVVQIVTTDSPGDMNHTEAASWANGAMVGTNGGNSYGTNSPMRAILFAGDRNLDFSTPEKALATIYGGFGVHDFDPVVTRQQHSAWAAQLIGDTSNPDYVALAPQGGAPSGAGAVTVAGPVVAGSGSVAAPSFAGSGAGAVAGPAITGAGSRTAPSFPASASATVASPAAAGAGTRTAPAFSGTGAGSVAGPSAASVGTSQPPAFSGAASVAVAGPVLTGSGVAAAPGASGSGGAVLAGPAAAAAGTRTAPVFAGSGALAIAASIVAAVGSAVAPSFTGTGGATVRGPAVAGAGAAYAPGATGSGAGTVAGPTLAASGSAAAPAAPGTGAASVAAPTATGSGTVQAPTFAGSGGLSVSPPSLAGSGSAALPGVSGVASASVAGPVAVGTGTTSRPQFSGAAAVSVAPPTLAAEGTSTPPLFSSAGAVALAGPQVAGAGAVVAPLFTGGGAATVQGPAVAAVGAVRKEGVVPTFARLTITHASAALRHATGAGATLRTGPRLTARLRTLTTPRSGGPAMPTSKVWEGQEMHTVVDFLDELGKPMAATGVTITVRAPVSGEVRQLAVEQLSPSQFRADWVANEAGTWHVRGECTGPAAAPQEDSVTVLPSQVLA